MSDATTPVAALKVAIRAKMAKNAIKYPAWGDLSD